MKQSNRQRRDFVALELALAALFLSSCTMPHRETRTRTPQPGESIQALLEQQVQDWNAGDIEGFMRVYWRSPNLAFFSDGAVTRGWQETLDRYHRRYPDRQAMGRLSFTDVDVHLVHSTLALCSGTWRLERATPVEGRFLLIIERRKGDWVIVVDYTTSSPSTSAPRAPGTA